MHVAQVFFPSSSRPHESNLVRPYPEVPAGLTLVLQDGRELGAGHQKTPLPRA